MPEQPNPDYAKAFSEACNQYRFFIEMRYKLLQIFALAQFGLSTMFWAVRTGLRSEAKESDGLTELLIRVAGIIICVVCALMDYRFDKFVRQNEKNGRSFSAKMGIMDFVFEPGGADKSTKLFRYLTLALYVTGVLVWLAIPWKPIVFGLGQS